MDFVFFEPPFQRVLISRPFGEPMNLKEGVEFGYAGILSAHFESHSLLFKKIKWLWDHRFIFPFTNRVFCTLA